MSETELSAEDGLPIVTLDGTLHTIRGDKSGEPHLVVWMAAWARALRLCETREDVRRLRRENGALLGSVAQLYPLDVQEVEARIEAAEQSRRSAAPARVEAAHA